MEWTSKKITLEACTLDRAPGGGWLVAVTGGRACSLPLDMVHRFTGRGHVVGKVGLGERMIEESQNYLKPGPAARQVQSKRGSGFNR